MKNKEVRKWQDNEALKRLEMITPLLEPDLDTAKKCQLREEIAEKNGVTVRSLYRYEKYYREDSFDGLRPANRSRRRSAKLPDNYDEIIAEAVQLKREVPRRSVRQIIKTYLSSLLDDHSRYILHSEFYDNQRAEIVEDTFHKAVLCHGLFDCAYLDRGTQYVSEQLHRSCAKLGIDILHAKPRACESKGAIEKFHQVVDSFIAEIRVAHVHSVEELNEKWKYFLEQEYQKKAHAGIREYYKSMDVEVPACGITPEQEWMRDTRKLVFADVGTVAEAFLHYEERQIDKAGCFSFNGRMYEASTSLAGAKVEIVYDPLHTEEIEVRYQGITPIKAKRVKIGAFADQKTALPIGMTDEIPETSRLLDEAHLLEKETLEEFRFLLNSEFDSASPLSLVLVGQTELWEQKLKMQSYTAIRQRIDMNIILKQLDRAETGRYITAHLAYAGGEQEVFTPGAEDEIYKVSSGVPRMINRICEKALMYSSQQKKKLIDEHVVNYVAEHEMVGGA